MKVKFIQVLTLNEVKVAIMAMLKGKALERAFQVKSSKRTLKG
jgi:hypothetical protein